MVRSVMALVVQGAAILGLCVVLYEAARLWMDHGYGAVDMVMFNVLGVPLILVIWTAIWWRARSGPGD